MARHDTVNDGKTKSRPLARGFGREEGIENTAKHRRWHAFPRVRYGESCVKTGIHRGIRRILRRGETETGKVDRDASSGSPHGVGRVGAEVHDYLLHLGRVRKHESRFALEVHPDICGSGQ